MPDGKLIDDADRLVLHEAQPLGAAPPVPVLAQSLFSHGAARRKRGLEPLGHGGAQLALVPAMDVGEVFKIRRDSGAIQKGALARGEFGNVVHGYSIAEAGDRVTAPAVRHKTIVGPAGRGTPCSERLCGGHYFLIDAARGGSLDVPSADLSEQLAGA